MAILARMADKDPAGIGFAFIVEAWPKTALAELLVRDGLLERGEQVNTYRLTAAGRKAGGW
jgi:hypothetical protein